MKIIRILVEVAPEDESERDDATHFEFNGRQWTMDGPVFPRIASALHEIVQLVKGRKQA